MRFWNYLYEKMSRDEVKDALSNDDILIGAEFEFICDDMKKSDDIQIEKDYEAALEAYKDWMSDLNDHDDRLHDIEADIENFETDINDLEDELADAEDSGDEEDIQDRLGDVKIKLRDAEDEKLDLEQEDIRPGPSLETYFDEYERSELDMLDPENNEPTRPENLELASDIEDEGNWLEIARDVLPNLIQREGYIKNYEIGGYDKVVQDKDTWAFEYDGSIAGDGGVEMKSPPMNLSNFIEILPKVFDFIGSIGGTNEKCGLHFHMSYPSASGIDMVKLILFTEEDYIYLFFPERINNNYAQKVKDKVEKGDPEEISQYFQKMLGKKVDQQKAEKLIGKHYDAIRKIDQYGEKTHVEFRYLGGSNYHVKEDDIKHLVGRYAHTLSLAVDPDYKRKEYAKKMMRLLNKIEAAGYMKLSEIIDEFIGEWLHELSEDYNLSQETEKKILDYLKIAKKKAQKRTKDLKVDVSKSLLDKIPSGRYRKKLVSIVETVASQNKFPTIKNLDEILFKDK